MAPLREEAESGPSFLHACCFCAFAQHSTSPRPDFRRGDPFLPVLTRFLEQPYENCAQQRQCVDDGDHVSPSRAAPCTSPAPHWGSLRGSSLRHPRKICWLVLQPPAPISPSISPVSETDGLGERVAPVENAGIHLHSRPYFSSWVKTLPKSAPAPCSPDC